MLNWTKSNFAGEKKQFLMEGYNWKTYGDMNQIFWERCQDVSLEDAKSKLEQTHQKILENVEKMTEEELFSKGVYDWVGGSNLGSYYVSVTSSHYDWALKKLKAHRKLQ